MLFCSNCGNEVPAGNKFCPNCGNIMEPAAKSQAPPQNATYNAGTGTYAPNRPKRLYRSRNNRVIAGVCGGVAKYTNQDPTLIRVLWVVFSLLYGTGIILYIVLALFVEEDPEEGVIGPGPSKQYGY